MHRALGKLTPAAAASVQRCVHGAVKSLSLIHILARQGMRNAYLLAVAPTSSTSILSGTTAGIDPIMKRFFLEEKKGSMLPRIAPQLSMETYWYYKAAHQMDQSWSCLLYTSLPKFRLRC